MQEYNKKILVRNSYAWDDNNNNLNLRSGLQCAIRLGQKRTGWLFRFSGDYYRWRHRHTPIVRVDINYYIRFLGDSIVIILGGFVALAKNVVIENRSDDKLLIITIYLDALMEEKWKRNGLNDMIRETIVI